MPKVSVMILTKNRSHLLVQALQSVLEQSYQEKEVVVVNDGSTDNTFAELEKWKIELSLTVITHEVSRGITASRQEALEKCTGEFVAILDDDDIWINKDKLENQVQYFLEHAPAVLVGGGMVIEEGDEQMQKMRLNSDTWIRNTMLFQNNFFNSTVMFRRKAALECGGFIKDGIDLGEDYDLWLRLGQKGAMYNFPSVFTRYAKPSYTKEKIRQFLKKQLKLVNQNKHNYPFFLASRLILVMRLYILDLTS